jgi:hypothetical protein
MSERLVDRVNFAKIVTVLASIFGIALGLCGVTFLVSSGGNGTAGFFIGLGVLELAVMGLSAVGLVVTVIVWVIASIAAGRGGRRSEGPQKLFDDAEDGKRKDQE